MPDVAFQFPDGFLWGAATAAHQVEGDNRNNDWWAWEQQPGHVKDGSTSGRACEHYERFAADFAQLRGMAHNAHRLSLEWSRIEPEPGLVDRAAVAHYREVLETLRALGMEPMVTLHHFTNPRWLADAGGWESDATPEAFRRFARLCVDEYGDIVRLWVTINEPNVYAYQSFMLGEWPPQKKSAAAGATVLRNMLRGHAAAYREIKGARPEAQVGVAQHLRVFAPYRRWNPLDIAVASLPGAAFNHWFLVACRSGFAGFPLGRWERVPEAAGTLDYIGVNYYARDRLAFDIRRPSSLFSRNHALPGAVLSDFQMEIYPEGLHELMVDAWRRYRLPLYVTENGVADAGDHLRPGVLVGHLAQVARALRDGVDVRSYMHWSSMDNFEWAEGYRMHFGLMEVDFATQARRPRPSAALYQAIIERNGLSWEDLEEHYPRALPHLLAGRAGPHS